MDTQEHAAAANRGLVSGPASGTTGPESASTAVSTVASVSTFGPVSTLAPLPTLGPVSRPPARELAQGQPAGLFGALPLETRLKIYGLVLEAYEYVDITGLFDDKLVDGVLTTKLRRLLRLCRLCRLIRSEVLQEFFSHSVVHLYMRMRAETTNVTGQGHLLQSRWETLSNPQLGVIRFREYDRHWVPMLTCPILRPNVVHASWLWTAEPARPDQVGALDWLASLPQLRSLEVVIDDPYIYRRGQTYLTRGRVGRYNQRRIDMFGTVHADRIRQFRLESFRFRLEFRDGFKRARWNGADWWRTFETTVRGEVITGQRTLVNSPVMCHLGALDRTRFLSSRVLGDEDDGNGEAEAVNGQDVQMADAE